jgi:hypothetical protein
MLCKARGKGLAEVNLERELAKLQKIWEACSRTGTSVRVLQLRGYVMHADSGAVIGPLRERDPSGSRGRTLREVDVSAVPKATRFSWAAHIGKTVDWLHSIGLVWGDGKQDNVIVDEDDQIWLIDLGGGWTEGWVKAELADMAEGDHQAL